MCSWAKDWLSANKHWHLCALYTLFHRVEDAPSHALLKCVSQWLYQPFKRYLLRKAWQISWLMACAMLGSSRDRAQFDQRAAKGGVTNMASVWLMWVVSLSMECEGASVCMRERKWWNANHVIIDQPPPTATWSLISPTHCHVISPTHLSVSTWQLEIPLSSGGFDSFIICGTFSTHWKSWLLMKSRGCLIPVPYTSRWMGTIQVSRAIPHLCRRN